MNEEITLKQFMTAFRSELDEFELFWSTNSKNDNIQYPESLRHGDWYEQFINFCNR